MLRHQTTRISSAILLLAATAVLTSPTPSAGNEDGLLPRYDHSGIGSASNSDDNMTVSNRYVIILVVHAICGFLAFQVFAPLAVAIAVVGRSWGPVWFHVHYRIQLWIVFPLTTFAVIMGAIASALPRQNFGLRDVMDKHKVMGFVLLGVLSAQMLVGYYAHSTQVMKERVAADMGRPEAPVKRRAVTWVHIAVGIALLTSGGLQVTWGFKEWDDHVAGLPIPTWAFVLNWIFASVPLVVVLPFVLVRGFLRMRRGQTFAQAFFSRPETPRYVPPRKLFLGSSTYIDEAHAAQVEEKALDGEVGLVGHEYGKGSGADGRQKVASVASAWPGHETREEYEADLESSRGNNSVVSLAPSSSMVFDYAQYGGEGEEHSSLLPSAAPLGESALRRSTALTSSPSPSIPSSYPPVSGASAVLPFIPPMPLMFPSTSTSPAPTTSSSSSIPPPPGPAFSPRLSFMPFAGPHVVHHHRRTNTAGTAAMSEQLLSTPTPNSSQTLPAAEPALKSPPSGEGESPVHVVPTPPPPASWESGELGRPRVSSVSTSAVAACDGEVGEGGEIGGRMTSTGVTRHMSMAGEVVTAEAESSHSLATTEEDAQAEAEAEAEEEEEGSVLADDAESTRLMDELERELSISISSARSGMTRGRDDEASAGAKEDEEVDEQTKLEREQSGKWFGGGAGRSSV
ncbi:hypothetical protein JCM1840_003555 [Sporobolomyces johnsonii]